MSRPSVAFLNRSYPPGRDSSGRVLRDLARAFARDGWEVTVITTGPQARQERDGSVRVVRLRGPARTRSVAGYTWLWIRMLTYGLTMPRTDLIVTMTDPPLLVVAGRILARLKKTKHMHWCQDLYPDLLPAMGIRLPPPIMKFLKVASRRAMKAADKVVVVGRCMARHLTHSGMDPRRVAVIPNWPDVELTEKAFAASQAAAAANGSGANGARSYEDMFRDTEPKFRILYSGNLGRAHPVQTVLDAAALLAGPHPEIEFVFVGDGPQFDRLAQERTRRCLENVRFLPWQPPSRLRELMESGDVHLISMNEGAAGLFVPCKLYAALAVGRPCILIGPENTETARIIDDFKAGAVVPQGCPERLAETIRTYRLDGDAWFSAHNGAARAGRIFVPDESIKAWVSRARDVANIPVRIRRRRIA